MESQEEKVRRNELFESAIAATGVGRFNIYLLLMAALATTAIMFASTTVAFVMPSAQCHLDISLVEKGYLYAITYAGMITSALPWAILSDTRGRKPVLVCAHLFDFLFYVMCAYSQTVTQLLIFKFFEGFCICGGYATLMTYLSEMHGREYRVRFLLFTGIMLTIASLLMPIFAIIIIPWTMEINFIGLSYHSWQVFILFAGTPSVITGISAIFIPESPKFLLAKGYHEAALETFQKIFTINTGQPKDEYPFKSIEAGAAKEKGNTDYYTVVQDGVRQVKPFFTKQYFWLAMNVFFVDFCVLMGQNTVRLWLPDLYASLEAYSQTHKDSNSLCTILELFNVEISRNNTGTVSHQSCSYALTAKSYINNLIPGGFSIASYVTAIIIIRYWNSKIILSINLVISALFGYCLLLASSEFLIVTITSLYLALENISSTTVVILCVSLFPTEMRTTSVSLCMMFGRIGSIIGNIVYPFLMKLGCAPPIIWLGTLGLVAFFISLVLPNPQEVPFE